MPKKPDTKKNNMQSRRKKFLQALRESGHVTRSAESANISRAIVYKWRDEDEEFARAWEDAVDEATERLEVEARRRAMGFDTDVWHDGQKVGVTKKYSDTLLIFLLKGMRPEKYRDRYDVKQAVDASVNIKTSAEDLTDDELAKIASKGKR